MIPPHLFLGRRADHPFLLSAHLRPGPDLGILGLTTEFWCGPLLGWPPDFNTHQYHNMPCADESCNPISRKSRNSPNNSLCRQDVHLAIDPEKKVLETWNQCLPPLIWVQAFKRDLPWVNPMTGSGQTQLTTLQCLYPERKQIDSL